MSTAYYEKLFQEDLALGTDVGTKRSPAGGTLVGTQVGIHSFGRNRAKTVATWDPASIPVGGHVSVTVTVVGAQLGDFVLRSFSLDLQGLTLTADVTAPNIVTVTLANLTAAAVDLASGVLSILVLPSR